MSRTDDVIQYDCRHDAVWHCYVTSYGDGWRDVTMMKWQWRHMERHYCDGC